MSSYADWAAGARVPLHFLLAALVLVFAQPTPRLLSAGVPLVLVGLAVRAWAAGHLRRESALTVSGPYAYLRHPLYVGTSFILAGFALAAARAELALLIVVYFLLFFVPVMQREEQERRARAPELYARYAAQVPAFWPRLTPAASGDTRARFDAALYRQNREWRAAVGCAVLLGLLAAKLLWG
ncbi:MAG: isoprenylcysteine carboxylmethyltransferase family protein [Acidobacteria bacterium]|nr:isoprenylcysteine carboxylmethyltransferase family protein [Acidobacteriota bacterium]